MIAPSGARPSVTKRQIAIKRLRAQATIDAPPPDDAIFLTIRPGLNDLRKLSQLFLRQAWLGTFRPVVDEALRPRNVEAMNPVAQVWRSMPPIFAAAARSIPSRTAAGDRRRRLWLTSFYRRAVVCYGQADHHRLPIRCIVV
jgi:hypothetical protein